MGDVSDFSVLDFGGGYSDSDGGDADVFNTTANQSAIVALTGDNNSLPVQTSVVTTGATDQQKLGSGGGNILGDIFGFIQQAPAIAKAAGTAIGTAKADLKAVGPNYTAAQTAASNQNGLQTWWLYASTTDKLMVGLAIAALVVALTHKGD